MRGRCRGLRGCGACLGLGSETLAVGEDFNGERRTSLRQRLVRRGGQVLRWGLRGYVRARTSPRLRLPKCLSTTPIPQTKNHLDLASSHHQKKGRNHKHVIHHKANHHSHTFRHQRLPVTNFTLPSLNEIELSDYEAWLMELYHDFLLEPTPYLVASAICYLGGVLVLVQYHAQLWWILGVLMQCVPWDDTGWG